MPSDPMAKDAALACGRFRLDPARRELRDGLGRVIALRGKTFDVLRLLLLRRDRLVRRAEILDAVWPDLHVTDDNVTQCIVEIRRALVARSGLALRTVHGHGYILEAARGARPTLSLVVLPFATVGASVPEALGQAVARDLLADLCGRPWLHVQACWTPWASNDPGQVGAAATPDLRLEGSVTRCAGRVRVSCALIAQATGTLVWGWRWDDDAAGRELVDLQDAIVRGLATGLLSATEASATLWLAAEDRAA